MQPGLHSTIIRKPKVKPSTIHVLGIQLHLRERCLPNLKTLLCTVNKMELSLYYLMTTTVTVTQHSTLATECALLATPSTIAKLMCLELTPSMTADVTVLFQLLDGLSIFLLDLQTCTVSAGNGEHSGGGMLVSSGPPVNLNW